MIFNYLKYGVIFGLMTILGWFIVPFLYPFRKLIRKHKENPFWYFLNDTTVGRDAGDYGRFKHNFIGYYRQCAIRNPHWNLKLKLHPKIGKKENVKGDLLWRNYTVLGKQRCTYTIDGTKYFRYSYSNGKFYYQFGASENRYIFKFKIKL